MAPLPPPRTPGHYRIALVCLGNICRSPIADVVLQAKLLGLLDDIVEVASCGTGGWHVGEPMDRRAAAVLHQSGYDGSRHRARAFDDRWLDDHDLLLAMDAANLEDLGGRSERVRMLRDLDPTGPGDVPDPYHGGDEGFRDVLATVERCCDALVAGLASLLGRAQDR